MKFVYVGKQEQSSDFNVESRLEIGRGLEVLDSAGEALFIGTG